MSVGWRVMRYLDVSYCFRFDIFMRCVLGSGSFFVCMEAVTSGDCAVDHGL